MLIAVDSGKHTTKALDSHRNTFSIRTQIDDSTILDGGTQVEFGGKQYIVGSGINDYDVVKSKLCHKLCTYVSIANLLRDKDQDVQLITGCPITHFINKEARQQHSDYYRGRAQIKIKNDTFNFNISSVVVLPESLGAIMTNPMEYVNSLIGVVDIGGLNVNGVIYDRLRPVKSSVFAMNEGGNILCANIKRALNTTFLANYQDYEIPHISDKKTTDVIDTVLNAQLDRIVEECKKYNWHVGAIPMIFTGGGSLLLEKQIKANNWVISKDPVWDNVRGFLKYAELSK